MEEIWPCWDLQWKGVVYGLGEFNVSDGYIHILDTIITEINISGGSECN